MSEQTYFTRAQAAEYLQISVTKLDDEARASRLFPRYFGARKVLYRRDDLDAWWERLPDENPEPKRRAG